VVDRHDDGQTVLLDVLEVGLKVGMPLARHRRFRSPDSQSFAAVHLEGADRRHHDGKIGVHKPAFAASDVEELLGA
jgi:hypothetical protein